MQAKNSRASDSRVRGKAIKPEYDFTHAERGEFFRPDAKMRLPIYLDDEVQTYLVERATEKGVPLEELVNGLLKQEIQKSVK
jgi:hypothetical protein